MTDEEITNFCEAMLKYFGSLPDPEHEPKRFAYHIKLYKHIMEKSK